MGQGYFLQGHFLRHNFFFHEFFFVLLCYQDESNNFLVGSFLIGMGLVIGLAMMSRL